MGAYEDYVNTELPRRSALLTYEITSYDGDPNDPGAPAILQNAPKGTWFLENTEERYWRKYTSDATSWRITESDYNQTTAVMHIYVRDVDGDDDNPGTSALPLATLTAAITKIPFFVEHTFIIHTGLHSGSGYACPEIPQHVLNANIWIIGDGGGAVGEDGFTEIVGLTPAQAGSDTDKVVTTGGLSTSEFGGFGEYTGYTIIIEDGAAAGDRRTIHHNTATDIVPNCPFTAAVTPGDTYRIVEAENIIYIPTSFTSPLVTNSGSKESDPSASAITKKVNFVNFKLDGEDSYLNLEVDNSVIGLFGIETAKPTTFQGRNSFIVSGMEKWGIPGRVISPVSDLGLGSDTEWTGWGLCSRSNSIGMNYLDFLGTINAPRISITYNNFGWILAGSLWDDYALSAGLGGYVFVFAYNAPIWLGGNSSNVGGYANYFGRMEFYAATAGYLQIRGDKALRARNKGQMFIANYGADAITIIGTTVGFQTEYEGFIHMPSGNPLPTMVCGGNDFSSNHGVTIHPISNLVIDAHFVSMEHGIIERH